MFLLNSLNSVTKFKLPTPPPQKIGSPVCPTRLLCVGLHYLIFLVRYYGTRLRMYFSTNESIFQMALPREAKNNWNYESVVDLWKNSRALET